MLANQSAEFSQLSCMRMDSFNLVGPARRLIGMAILFEIAGHFFSGCSVGMFDMFSMYFIPMY
jgi:hypothetical protein